MNRDYDKDDKELAVLIYPLLAVAFILLVLAIPGALDSMWIKQYEEPMSRYYKE